MVGKKRTLYIEDDVLKDLEQDTFGHKHIAEAVVNSIQNTNPPFTIGIFGGWGDRKKFVIRNHQFYSFRKRLQLSQSTLGDIHQLIICAELF